MGNSRMAKMMTRTASCKHCGQHQQHDDNDSKLVNQSGKERTVFLGGSCGVTTWRKDVAIPLLQNAGAAFYNPQVDEWAPELIEAENCAKRDAEVLLFVIDDQTRALMSIMEAVECIVAGRKVALAIRPLSDGQAIDNDTLGAAELKDLNRSRIYLADVAARYGVPVHSSVEEAVFHCVSLVGRGGRGSKCAGAPILKRSHSLPMLKHPHPAPSCSRRSH